MPRIGPFSKVKVPPINSAFDNERLTAILNNMSEGVMAIDNQGLITLCNGAALNLLDVNNLVGQKIQQSLKLVDKNNQLVDIDSKILTTKGTLTTSDWRLRYKDGSTINLFISASPVHQGYGQKNEGGLAIVLRDISQEKAIEEEREEFVSVASHELRTPVAIVEGNVSNAILLAQKGNTSDAVKQSLAEAHDQILFLGNLINDLSMLSRAERGKLAMTIEAFDVDEMVDALVHDYQPQAKLKKLTLKKQAQQSLGKLSSSPLYVREMLQNFITNALKYTDKGGVSLSAVKKDNGVEFNIIDSGIGISQSEQRMLFSKFFRGDDWRVRKVNGTGLGLYVTAKLAKLLGATINMESQINKGSRFSLFVPNLEDKLPLEEVNKKV